MSGQTTVMVLGLGGVGYETLQNLSRDQRVDHVVTGDITGDRGRTRTATARYKADLFGQQPELSFYSMDLLESEGVVEAIEATEPDVIFTAMSLVPYDAFEALPESVTEALLAFAPNGPGFACIVPGQLPLVYNLMDAVEQAEVPEPHVVNVSMPDIVNPALDRVGKGPVVGSGNVGLLVGPIKQLCSHHFDVPMHAVDCYISIAQSGVHAAFVHGSLEDVPYYLKVIVDGTDVSEEFDLASAIEQSDIPFPVRPNEPEISTITGASSAKIVGALLDNTGEKAHVPGPNGLPGGFPVRIHSAGATVVLPDDISTEAAVDICREGNQFNGIKRIKGDGTIVFTEQTRDIFDEYLGVDVPSCTPSDALDVTAEIIHGYQNLAEAHGMEPRIQVTW